MVLFVIMLNEEEYSVLCVIIVAMWKIAWSDLDFFVVVELQTMDKKLTLLSEFADLISVLEVRDCISWLN